MRSQLHRQLHYYMRLDYPVHVTYGPDGFTGTFPDLPGASLVRGEVSELYVKLHEIRCVWITERLERGLLVPLPYSAGETPSEGTSG